MTRYSSWSVLFAIASLCLAAVLWFRLAQTAAPDTPPTPPKKTVRTGPASQVAPSARLGKRDAYAAIAQRPLFSPTRRPLDSAPATAASQPRKSLAKFVLTGVIIVSAEEKIALIQEAKSPAVQRLSEGQSIAGWRIEKILPDRVTLVSGDETAEIPLWSDQAPPQPRQSAKPQPRRPGIKLPVPEQRK
jgi:type II secretory pathway component PulC